MNGAAAPTVGADDSNIPGIPLPAAIVTGRLGGPIYDHVYSIDASPGRVIVLSLTGERDADFGLYLFDSTATTVYATAGQVAVSAWPGSTQSIRYPTPAGGRYYVDVNGASNVEGSFRLSVSISPDTNPPDVRLSLDGGAPATNDPTVRVTLAAADDLSGVDAMQFSSDSLAWTAWQPYTPTTVWTFPNGDADEQLWARVRDGAGNVSGVVTASIVLDTAPPTVLSRRPAPGEDVIGLQPTFAVQFSKPIQSASWLDLGLLIQDRDGTTIHGTYTWNAGSNTGQFTPSLPLIAGAAYVVTLGSIVDVAGNALSNLGSWVVRALAAHTTTISATPSVLATEGTARLAGTIDGSHSAPLLLEQSIAGGPWGAVSVVDVDADGRFSVSVSVVANSEFRTHYLGNATEAEAVSSPARVLVRRSIGISAGSVSARHGSSAGRVVPISAVVGPSTPDVMVTLSVLRYDSARHLWRQAAILVRTTKTGTARFSWRPTVAGQYRFRASTPPTPLFANAVSPNYAWGVR